MNKEKESSLFSETQERLFNGIIKENPTFVLLLGMCPTLAVTTSAVNGLGMGLTTMFVLALSNLFISLLRKVIPNKIRIPAFIVIIASFVTIVELLLEAYLPSLNDALGVYIPLIVVNCIILGRAEAYAYHNPPIQSLFDGLGMGLGFSFALTIIGGVREILGSGSIFNVHFMPSGYVPVSIFVMAPGAFFVLACLTAIQNKIKIIGESKGKDMSKIQSGCGGDCAHCVSDCVDEEKKAETPEITPSAEPVNEEVKENKGEEATTEAKPASEPSESEIKQEEVKAKTSETPEKAETPDSELPEDEIKKETETPPAEKPEAESDASREELELINLDDYKKAINRNNVSGRRPSRKKSSDKAKELLKKAEATEKEEN